LGEVDLPVAARLLIDQMYGAILYNEGPYGGRDSYYCYRATNTCLNCLLQRLGRLHGAVTEDVANRIGWQAIDDQWDIIIAVREAGLKSKSASMWESQTNDPAGPEFDRPGDDMEEPLV
jgi:hypothetical protein